MVPKLYHQFAETFYKAPSSPLTFRQFPSLGEFFPKVGWVEFSYWCEKLDNTVPKLYHKFAESFHKAPEYPLTFCQFSNLLFSLNLPVQLVTVHQFSEVSHFKWWTLNTQSPLSDTGEDRFTDRDIPTYTIFVCMFGSVIIWTIVYLYTIKTSHLPPYSMLILWW